MPDALPTAVRPQDLAIATSVLALVPLRLAKHYTICPLTLTETGGVRTLTVAARNSQDPVVVDLLQRTTGCRVQLVEAAEHDILLGLTIHYAGGLSEPTRPPASEPAPPPPAKPASTRDLVPAEAVRIVDEILQRAIAERATDIHIEPFESTVYVRFRIDGFLYDHTTYALTHHAQVISRIKILANLDIAQNRLGQDGRFDIGSGAQAYDIRVSIAPLLTGQKAVLRLLPKGPLALGFTQLGITATSRDLLQQLIHRPYGMILATGPTGSGKTTTLYACLSQIDNVAKNIVTIEDPVEYQFNRIAQIQVHPRIGLTFAEGLRTILRQDPDVIMVGEIRDRETLDMAIQSALTGHLVFSTLHCNDAAAGAARMVDMGAEPFLIASSVIGIIAQRLVRRICEKCRKPVAIAPAVRKELGLPDDRTPFFQGAGCEACRYTGYYGRISVFEVVPMVEPIQQAIIQKATAGEIRAIIRRLDLPTLYDDGLAKAREGITTLEEVMRAVYVDVI